MSRITSTMHLYTHRRISFTSTKYSYKLTVWGHLQLLRSQWPIMWRIRVAQCCPLDLAAEFNSAFVQEAAQPTISSLPHTCCSLTYTYTPVHESLDIGNTYFNLNERTRTRHHVRLRRSFEVQSPMTGRAGVRAREWIPSGVVSDRGSRWMA